AVVRSKRCNASISSDVKAEKSMISPSLVRAILLTLLGIIRDVRVVVNRVTGFIASSRTL
ncbi:MAG: hypothetical protein WBJ04_01725, partial [Bacillota bacterium]